ncbi:MAG: ABC transporter permease subunit, partial [Dehalococcoidia bacterium]|nr:ABC transporter permease subunit [Dehalococcoidia bacterium]
MTAETNVTEATATDRAGTNAPGFLATFSAEWTKLTSVRSTYVIVLLTIVLAIGMTALVALATGSTWDDWNANNREQFDPVLFSAFGAIFTGILLTVLGVLSFGSEYSSGMIRLTFTVTSRRWRVLIAKAIAIAIITWVTATVATVGMYLVGQAVLEAFDMPTVAISESDGLRTVLALSLTAPFFPIIGLALAVLMRNTAGAITTALALFFLPAIFGGLLPTWWQENVLAFNPTSASDALAFGHLDDSAMYLDAPLAAVVVVAWFVIFMGAAHIT